MTMPIVHKNELSLEELVLLAQKGNQNAMSHIVMRLMPLVRKKAAKYKSTQLETDDLLQEGLIGLLSAVKGFSCESQKPFLPYAATSVQNSMVSALRKSLGARSVKSADVVPLEEDFMEAPTLSLEEQQDLREDCERLWNLVMTRLSKTEKQALHLFLCGYSYAEVAEKMQISEKSVDNALQRVRTKLKKDTL